MADSQLGGNRATFWDAVQDTADQPYIWGNAGPGTVTMERVGAVIPVSTELLADMLPPIDFTEMMRRDAIHRRAMRRLKVADPTSHARLQALLRLAAAARQDREERERIARTCPHCGCDPLAHEERD